MKRDILFAGLLIILTCSIILNLPPNTPPLYRSTDLNRVIKNNKKEYKLNGILTNAANLHYAMMVSVETEKGVDGESRIIEIYFDENGNPAKLCAGNYAFQKTYVNNINTSVTYLDVNLRPMMNTSGYCTKEIEYKNDVVVAEWYKDVNGKAVATAFGVYGRLNVHENGRNTVVKYVDTEGKPMYNRSGYAICKRTFYEKEPWVGNVENELYFDDQELPIALSLGQYGVHKEYDELGRNNIVTYLNEDCQPMVTRAGYTTVKRTFYPDDSIRTERYFDLYGEPVALAQGQYGILKENGNTTFLNIEGKPQFILRKLLYKNSIIAILIALVIVVCSMILGRKVNICILVAYIVFVLYMTLMYRSAGDTKVKFELFWSYKQFFNSSSLRIEILNNIWLFVPLGAILYKLWPQGYILLIPILFSVLIETIQYFTGLGLSELDDVISNGLGVLIGFEYGYVIKPIVKKKKLKHNKYEKILEYN